LNMTLRKLAVLLMSCLLFFMVACTSGGAGSEQPSGETEKPAETEAPAQNNTEKPAEQPAEAEKPKDPIELRVGILTDGMAESNEPLAKAFQAKYPHVTVKFEPANTGDYRGKILTQAASGDLPDVVFVIDAFLRDFAAAGVLAELDGLLADNGVNIDEIYPGMRKISQMNDKLYMAPVGYTHIVTFVNKTLLENEGIPMPDNNWTWEQFLDIAKKVTKTDAKGNATQWGLLTDSAWEAMWTPFLLGRGGSPVDLANKKVTLTDPLVVQGLKDFYDLTVEGYAVDLWAPIKPEGEHSFENGKFAFTFGTKGSDIAINKAFEEKGLEWDVLPFPELPEKRVTFAGTAGFGVYAKAKYTEEAAAFVSFVLSQEWQKTLAAQGDTIPVLQSLANEESWRNSPVPGKNADAYVSFPEADILSVFVDVPLEAANEAKGKLIEARNNYMTNAASLEDGLKIAEEAANAKWK